MSRTYRRKKASIVDRIRDYKWGYVDYHNKPGFVWFGRVFIGDEALLKEKVKFHMDKRYDQFVHPPRSYREIWEQRFRADCKQDLNKFLALDEHEVMILSKPCRDYFD